MWPRSGSWELYDRLIDGLPDDATVEECTAAPFWTVVKASCGAGLAMTPSENALPTSLAGRIAGMKLKDLAEYVKAWNNREAAMGLAAINAFHNYPRKDDGSPRHAARSERGKFFAQYEKEMRGKKVAVIGHFPRVEEYAKTCELSVLERRCTPGDYPDPACEYLLPRQDMVFITGSALENKTMPRLLQLSAEAFTVVLGPSTPLAGVLFEFGVDVLHGNTVADYAAVRRIAGEGGLSVDLAPYAPRRVLRNECGRRSAGPQ